MIRGLAYALAFYGGSVPIVLATPIVAIFGHAALVRWVISWTRFQAGCASLFLGIRTQVQGRPASGPALYASKHQSMFETFELIRLLNGPSVVMRREFARIPVWGWAAKRYGIIIIDRRGSAAALRQMMREGAAAKSAGRSVVIFPEGTRVAPGDAPPLKPGLAGLYRALGMPLVAIALNSGRVWPKKGIKRPGVVTIDFGEPLPIGLPRDQVEAAVHAGINRLEPPPYSPER